MNENEIMLQGCRVCGKPEQYANLFYNINKILLHNLVSLIDKSYEITENNGSKFICRNCTEQVENFIKFRQQFEETSSKVQYLTINLDQKAEDFQISLEEKQFEEAQESSLLTVIDEEIIVDECESQTVDLFEPKKFQCETCFKSYSHANSLTRHIQTKHNSVRYQCFLCPSEFTQKSSLNEHCRNVHKEIDKNECDCGQNFTSKKLLDQHLKTHDSEKKKTDCTQADAEKKKYRKQCQICGLFFKHIEEHKLTHFAEKTYHCNICAKSFKFKPSLDQHSRIHKNERRFSCSFCNKAFRVSHHLKEHISSLHSNEKNFICSEKDCLKKFSSKLNLYKHSKIHKSKLSKEN